jgi:hypothetical protein
VLASLRDRDHTIASSASGAAAAADCVTPVAASATVARNATTAVAATQPVTSVRTKAEAAPSTMATGPTVV